MKKIFSLIFALSSSIHGIAETPVIIHPVGQEPFAAYAYEQESVDEIIDRSHVEAGLPQEEGEWLVYLYQQDFKKKPAAVAKPSSGRNYAVAATTSQRADIKFIVTTLGQAPLLKINGSRSDLKKAGDRVDQVHPLRFLEVILSDQEMRASLKTMKGRSWVWAEFFNGLQKTLDQESAKNNLKPEYVSSFVTATGLNGASVASTIAAKDWNGFMNIILGSISAPSDAYRYDM